VGHRSERYPQSHGGAHAHVPPGTVLTAAALTVLAAAAELAGSLQSGSLFLTADALHLVAHLGIFCVLLIPTARWHERGEDLAAIGVLAIVTLIALAITSHALDELRSGGPEPPVPSYMLLALLGLGANLTTAYLFRDPAETHWSFRAALAHELADGALTIAGLIGALTIKLFAWRWVDPGLTLLIGLWLIGWAGRLLARRMRQGSDVWTLEA